MRLCSPSGIVQAAAAKATSASLWLDTASGVKPAWQMNAPPEGEHGRRQQYGKITTESWPYWLRRNLRFGFPVAGGVVSGEVDLGYSVDRVLVEDSCTSLVVTDRRECPAEVGRVVRA